MSYLKYYFEYDGKLSFNSIACVEGESVVEPANFLKWYEDGDFAPMKLTDEEKDAIARSESPGHAMMFMPRKVTFSVDEFLKRKNAVVS